MDDREFAAQRYPGRIPIVLDLIDAPLLGLMGVEP